MPSARLSPFLIDASLIIDFQACRRRYLLSRKWRPQRWQAKLLFDSCLRRAILSLGEGKDVKDVISEASSRFMSTGANAGLDVVGVDPYTVAQDYCAMLETVLHAISKRNVPKMKEIKAVKIGRDIDWVFLAYQDIHGELHRTITVDRWDDERLTQEMHSWYVFGDIAAAGKPMNLHVIEIGRMRDGRRHSPWVRAWEQEHFKGRIMFQKKSGGKLEGAWKPIFLPDTDRYSAADWVGFMDHENVTDTLFHDVQITVPSIEHIKDFKRQVQIEARQMMEWEEAVTDPRIVPMSRASCDNPYPCRFSPICFSPIIEVDVPGLGLYKLR